MALTRRIKLCGTSSSRVLRVDLGTRRIWRDELDPESLRHCLGGPSTNIELFRRWQADDPFILGVGRLTGTLAPGAAVLTMTACSPVNGRVYHVMLTGHAGAEIRFAGFENVVIHGEATEPLILSIRRGEGALRPAAEIWGKDVWESVRGLRTSDPACGRCVLTIGPAGEKCLPYAQICQGYWGTFDKQGFGSILGRKKLKAILIDGTGAIAVDDEAVEKAHALRRKITCGILRDQWGVKSVLKILSDDGFTSRIAKRIARNHHACFGCPFPCRTYVRMLGRKRHGEINEESPVGILLTDPIGLFGVRKLGLDAFSFLAETFRLGLEPLAAALILKKHHPRPGKEAIQALQSFASKHETLTSSDLPHIHNLPPWPLSNDRPAILTQAFGALGMEAALGVPGEERIKAPDAIDPVGMARERILFYTRAMILGICPVLLLIVGTINAEGASDALPFKELAGEVWDQMDDIVRRMLHRTIKDGMSDGMMHASLKWDTLDQDLQSLAGSLKES